jgi:hypothetical protein
MVIKVLSAQKEAWWQRPTREESIGDGILLGQLYSVCGWTTTVSDGTDCMVSFDRVFMFYVVVTKPDKVVLFC